MPVTRDEFDCITCGACCIYFAKSPDCFPIYPGDPNEEMLLENEWAHKSFHGDTFMLRKDGERLSRCIALSGKRGEQLLCEVYENRPQTCRDFEAGGNLCREARKAVYGIE